MVSFFSKVDSLVWGAPLILLLLGTGIYFTFRLHGLQFSRLKLAFSLILHPKNDTQDGDVSSFQALCTALSSTIGTGNIVGVATAIAAGGPGALFWMWISAFFGMATKFSEGLLAIKYRTKDENGQVAGGPMYYLQNGLHNTVLAKMFAVFGVGVALFGIGTFTQVSSISDALTLSFNVPTWVSAIVLTALVAFITLGGIRRIAHVAEKIIPFMCVFYIGGVLLIVLTHLSMIPSVIALVIKTAFVPQAAVGGGLGIAVQKGISRGIFSNESGLGSAPIAAAAAKTDSCVEQGLISMTGTFIDTIVVCTMTGLAILITQANLTGLEGAAMTTYAFENGLFIPMVGRYIVNIGLVLFAFTTIIGWNYYGERCMYYLAGMKAVKVYKIVFLVLIAIGPFMSLEFVFILADIVNGLMAIPNLIGLIGLRKDIITETEAYFMADETETVGELAEESV
ncbi:alanine/glycine:cation symporter family protein [Catenisphaera adipataccumulans]|jgi:AGCS family alanine or glycine:cation symporter|uniref:AGCS family alanine or glycine:cation symporter n=1 Tax=Catenisphaera adipataccumulans TaxID=700500 RepID=A0A7W8FVN9_9FIRM|nr:sodium:alanine symporter family protein [Catenisphaera adipataccumulans]MBB5183819.1 AGCS family alanine or glycine:cation symporter [Catenisphaera adipataccumulans]